MRYSFCESAQGPLLVAIDQDGLRFVEFVRGEQPVTPRAQWQRDDVALAPYLEQFEAYFAGRLRRFTLPLAARGTPFQQSVWRRHSHQALAAGIGATDCRPLHTDSLTPG